MNAINQGIKHSFYSFNCWQGEYYDKKKGESYTTVLCNWKCRKCGMEIIAHPENLGEPIVSDDCKKGV